VNFSKQPDGAWLGELERLEWLLLREVLQMFPVTPVDHHRASKGSATVPDSSQLLLRDAAIAQKAFLRTAIRDWIQRERVTNTSAGAAGTVRLRLTAADLEHLLQVLNDIRVGSWLALGCPDDHSPPQPPVTGKARRFHFAMEFCGLVQSRILTAMNDSR
jgi:hypothetical protein